MQLRKPCCCSVIQSDSSLSGQSGLWVSASPSSLAFPSLSDPMVTASEQSAQPRPTRFLTFCSCYFSVSGHSVGLELQVLTQILLQV